MRVNGPPLRRLLAAASTGAAMIALGASASAANAASAVIHYTCAVPLIGNQPLYVDIQAPTFPTTATVGAPTDPFGISAGSVTGGNTYLAISLTGTAKLTDASPGFAGTTQALVTQSDGTTVPVTVPVSIGSYNVPASAPLRLTATGTSPAVTPTVAGPAKVTVGNLALNLRAFKADGTPVALGSASDSDGDVNSFDMACTVAKVGEPSSDQDGNSLGNIATAQDTTLGTINVAAPNQAPSAPANVAVSNVTETSADISWDPSTDSDGTVAGYEVYVDGSKVADVTGTSASLSGLTPSTLYSVTVKAKDNDGALSAESTAVNFTTATPDNPPSTPANVAVSNVTETSADVSWDASTDDNGVTGYQVFLDGTKVDEVTGTSASLTGLTQDTSYSVTVKAVDTKGQLSDASSAATFKTVKHDNPPSAPANVTFSNVTDTSADVSWDASTDDNGVTGYEVYLDGTKVADATGTSTSLSGLTASTTYSVTVKAKDTKGQLSDASSAASLTTAAPPDNPPSKPGNVAVSNVTDTSADVSWDASTDDHNVVGYEVYLDGSKVADVTDTSASLSGLTGDTLYSVTVKAKDDAGQLSDASDAVNFTTAPTPDNPPSAPTNVAVSNVTDTAADVSWDASTDDHTVAGYEVYLDGNKVADVTDTSVSLSGLTPQTTYSLTVKAKDDAGQLSDASAAVELKTTATPDNPPSKPANVTVANVTDTSADVSWDASTDDHTVAGYEVYLDGNKVADVTDTNVSLSGLTEQTSYTVTVKAKDDAGQLSDASDAAQFTTLPTPDGAPSAPANVAVSNITETSADVSWDASTDDHGVTGYEVYLDGNKVADVTDTSASLTGLTQATSYTVTVKAKDTSNQLSDSSSPVSFTTKTHVNSAPSKPGNVQVANITTTSADVSWDASSDSDGSVVGYEVYLDGTKVADATGTSTSLSGLTATTSYTVTVKAKDDLGTLSDASDAVVFQTATPHQNEAPSAPANVSVANVTTTSADVSWDASSDSDGSVAGYEVYLDGTKVADVTDTSATLTGLTENTSYTVTVRAKDNEGALSDSSDPVVFKTTQHVNSAPSAPANVAVANVTETTADVSWDPSTDSDGTIAGYEVYLDGTKVADASGTTVTLTGLTADTAYSVTVKALDNEGALSDASDAASFTTAQHADVPPTAPTNVAVGNISDTTADVSWDASTDSDGTVAGYEVYVNGNKVGDAPGTTFTLTGLSQTTTYSVTVKAKDDLGALSDASDAVSFTTKQTPDTEAPSKPGTPTATSTSSSVTLTWGASSDNVGVDGYDVYQGDTKVKSVSGTSATITGLTADTSYTFKVQARDAAGNTSPFSDTVTVKTQPSTPSTVTVKYGLKGSTTIKAANGSAPLNGSINATMDLSTGNFSADLALNPTVAHLRIFGFLPVDAQLAFAPQGKTTGSLSNGILSATSKVTVKVPAVQAFGFITIAGGSKCQTASPATIPLKSTGTFNPVAGGNVSGTYTLPSLKDCGPLTGVLSALTSGPGNTISAKLTPQS